MQAMEEERGSHPADLVYWIFLGKEIFERYRRGTTWITARPGRLEFVYGTMTGICIISNHITVTCNFN